MTRPRILLGDDHGIILEGLRSLLTKEFDVVGVASNGRELVTETERLKPDVVLVDVSMPVLNGMEAARQIKNATPAVKLLFVTQKADREYVQAAFRIGASGYVLKQSAVGELVPALREVLAGHYYIASLLRQPESGLFTHPQRNPADLFGGALTSRQRQVLQACSGRKSKQRDRGGVECVNQDCRLPQSAHYG